MNPSLGEGRGHTASSWHTPGIMMIFAPTRKMIESLELSLQGANCTG